MPLCVFLSCLLSAPIEEVVVTATLRPEPLEDVPASIVVLERDTLEAAGVQHFQDVLGLTPNLNWSAGTSRPRYLQIRGIGELEQYQGAPNPSVGFLVDGIDFSGIGGLATLFDLEQIEVLRGPQGTLYGANALAGLVNVRSRAPEREPEARLEATSGDRATWGLGASLGGALPRSETAAWRLAAQRYSSEGFRRNAFLGRDDVNGHDETVARARLAARPRESLGLDLTAMLVDLDNGYDAFAIDNGRVTRSDDPGRDAQRSLGLAARLEYEGFETWSLRSESTFADSDIVYAFDGDWGNDRDWGPYAPYRFVSSFDRRRRTVSQELRAASKPGWGPAGRVDWVAGLYLLDARETNAQLDLYNGEIFRALDSRYEATSLAAYGQIDLPLGERTVASAGLRVERRDTDYLDSDGGRFGPAETMRGGQVSLRHAFDARRSAYVSVSRGYKAGGFNIGALVPEERRLFAAEHLTSLELGVRVRSADESLLAQAAIFHMRRGDQQVNTSFQLDPGDPLSFIFLTGNAARGENSGLEASLEWRAGERLRLSASAAALETRYLGYSLGDRDLDGREQAHAPEYQYALGAEYRHPRGWFARLDAQGSDDFFFDVSHDERAPAYTLVHLKAGFEAGRWAAHLWARNLFDEDHAMRGFYFGLEPAGDPAAPDFPPKRYVQAGDGRALGLTLRYELR